MSYFKKHEGPIAKPAEGMWVMNLPDHIRKTLPLDNGYHKALEYVPKHRQQEYWEKNREWLKTTEKRFWLGWHHDEIERRRAIGKV